MAEVLSLSSLGEMAIHLTKTYAATKVSWERALSVIARKVARTAQSEYGRYQRAVGPFAAWAPLSPVTMEIRERLGFTPDDPLFRMGLQQAAVEWEVEDFTAAIGSKEDVMALLELGDERIPPRAVFGPALWRNREFVAKKIGEATLAGIMLGRPALRYIGP